MKTAIPLLLTVVGFHLHAQAPNPLTAIVTERFERLRLDVEESAEVMPAEKYTFRLTDGQRAFGEWVAHVIGGNYNYCSVIRGEGQPERAKAVHQLKTKAELVPAVKESFVYCADALKDMNDQKALAPAGPNRVPPVRGMVNLVSSQNEHYGNMVGYMRANNIVPPSTARAERQRKAKKK